MDEQNEAQPIDFIELAGEIVSAYVSNNSVPVAELSALISGVHAALAGLGGSVAVDAAGPERPTPVQIRKSISPDALISFEDGKSYKTLRRHLTLRGLTPEDYRAKWSLPPDYPMTAAAYSAQRSALARELGLGQQRRKSAPEAVVPEATGAETVPEAPKTRGRPRKAVEAPSVASKARGPAKVAEPA